MIHNLYLALCPSPDEAERMIAARALLRQRLGLAGRDKRPENFHVSVYGLGPWDSAPEWLMEGVANALEQVQIAAFLIEFDRVMTFGGGAFALTGGENLSGIRRLREELDVLVPRHMPALGRPEPLQLPHLTLLHDKRRVRETFIEPIVWEAREVVLIDSLYGLGRHVRIGGRRLGARAE